MNYLKKNYNIFSLNLKEKIRLLILNLDFLHYWKTLLLFHASDNTWGSLMDFTLIPLEAQKVLPDFFSNTQ